MGFQIIQYFLLDPAYGLPADIRAQDFRHLDAAIRLLVILHDRGDRTPHRKPTAV